MPELMMSTKEVADYLGIHEKQVYALIKQKKIPCTRVTGKWLFPRDIIDEWIRTSAQKDIHVMKTRARGHRGALLASGSNDPVLNILFTYMKNIYPDFHIYTSATGSTEGLHLLMQKETDIAWCHLFDPQSGGYNIPQVAEMFRDMDVAVVHLFYRELGFVVSPKSEKNVNTFEDLTVPGVRFINRQKGSGTRLLLDYNLGKAGIDPANIQGYGDEVYTHMEVGLSLLSGEYDVGIASVAISRLLGLKFAPLVRESFDMVLLQKTFFDKWVQALIEVLGTEQFRKKVEPLGSYDFTEAGKIIYSSTS